MRMCQAHWDRLRAAVKARGLWPLVARNGAEAMKRTVDELEGTADKATYDPLMNCVWMIYGRATQQGGLYLFTGDLCPICEAVKHSKIGGEDGYRDTAHVEEHWIDGPADAVLQFVRDDAELSALLEVITP
jgi:hypothetical protein